MKKFIYTIAIAIIASSCGVLKPTERTVDLYFADYREFAEEGFLISPDSYTYDFESLGEIEMVITPAIKKYGEEGDYGPRGTFLDYEEISHNELVKLAVEEAKKMGADAIVNFSITKTPIAAKDVWGTYASGSKYLIKGFCIKRK